MAALGLVVPGERLPSDSTSTVEAGSSFAWAGTLRASVAGKITGSGGAGSCSVRASRKRTAEASAVLSVGDTVVGRVTRLTKLMAQVDILCVGGCALREPCAGLLRREDVRPAEQRTLDGGIELHRCVRPGDVLLASVLSLGDSRAYYLSTVANEHGVVIARSAEGATMKPVSFCEMECPLSHVREKRKVAKPPEAAKLAPATEDADGKKVAS